MADFWFQFLLALLDSVCASLLSAGLFLPSFISRFAIVTSGENLLMVLLDCSNKGKVADATYPGTYVCDGHTQ